MMFDNKTKDDISIQGLLKEIALSRVISPFLLTFSVSQAFITFTFEFVTFPTLQRYNLFQFHRLFLKCHNE